MSAKKTKQNERIDYTVGDWRGVFVKYDVSKSEFK